MQYDARATWLRSAATGFAVASIVLVCVNAALVLRNQDAQRVINQRQAVINQATQIARVNQLLTQTIARTAVARNDGALVALLERHGFHITETPGAASAAPAAPAIQSGSQP